MLYWNMTTGSAFGSVLCCDNGADAEVEVSERDSKKLDFFSIGSQIIALLDPLSSPGGPSLLKYNKYWS
jgi:hypothetical protein